MWLPPQEGARAARNVPTAPPRESQRERRERLGEIAEQVARGELVIRQATAEERRRFGIRTDVLECEGADDV